MLRNWLSWQERRKHKKNSDFFIPSPSHKKRSSFWWNSFIRATTQDFIQHERAARERIKMAGSELMIRSEWSVKEAFDSYQLAIWRALQTMTKGDDPIINKRIVCWHHQFSSTATFHFTILFIFNIFSSSSSWTFLHFHFRESIYRTIFM